MRIHTSRSISCRGSAACSGPEGVEAAGVERLRVGREAEAAGRARAEETETAEGVAA